MRRFSCAAAMLLLLHSGSALAHREPTEEISQLTHELQGDPSDPETLVRRAQLYRQQGRYAEALDDLAKARRLAPVLPTIDLAQAQTLLASGCAESALESIDRLLQGQPEHVVGGLTRARILASLGQALAAHAEYSRLIVRLEASNAPGPELYLERARVLVAAGPAHLGEAIDGLDEAITRLGNVPALTSAAIDLEITAHRLDAALARIAVQVAQTSHPEPWLVRQGRVLELAGRHAEARVAYEGALNRLQHLASERPEARASAEAAAAAREGLQRLDTPATSTGGR